MFFINARNFLLTLSQATSIESGRSRRGAHRRSSERPLIYSRVTHCGKSETFQRFQSPTELNLPSSPTIFFDERERSENNPAPPTAQNTVLLEQGNRNREGLGRLLAARIHGGRHEGILIQMLR